ncbi:hypothetical protein D3C75_1240970 [compost metagenome]
MKPFALSNKAFSTLGDQKPSLDRSLEKLRRYKEADNKLQEACARLGIQAPKLVSDQN